MSSDTRNLCYNGGVPQNNNYNDRMCDTVEYDGVTYVWDEYDMLVPVDEA